MNQKSSPILTILTRCYQRPLGLKRCKESLLSQTDPNFEHMIMIDQQGHDIHWANKQIVDMAGKINGDYVYILDDDDFVICENFIHELNEMLLNIQPNVFIVKGWIHEKSFPKRWRSMPAQGEIAAPNFIVSRDIFNKYASYWDMPRRGDFNFINCVLQSQSDIYWWDRYIFYADPSSGKTEKEKNVIREQVYY